MLILPNNEIQRGHNDIVITIPDNYVRFYNIYISQTLRIGHLIDAGSELHVCRLGLWVTGCGSCGPAIAQQETTEAANPKVAWWETHTAQSMGETVKKVTRQLEDLHKTFRPQMLTPRGGSGAVCV